MARARNSPVLHFASGRIAIVGGGSVHKVEIPAPWNENALWLQKYLIDHHQNGGGNTAFIAFPFLGSEPATAYIPQIIVESSIRPAEVGTESDWELKVTDGRDRLEWREAVVSARDKIRTGALDKVVLARDVIASGFDLTAEDVLERMVNLYPHNYRFCVDGFVGSSPELLVQRVRETVRAQPMAGTLPTLDDPDANTAAAEELMASEKNRKEHQITIDMVHDALLGWCSYLDAEPTPRVINAGPVQHLATLVEGHLSDPKPSVLELVTALHPTPAVGGWPSAPALETIEELEVSSRGRYAGPVGWFNVAGEGAFAVGIRSAEIDGDTARLFAGVGVVADSDPDAELAESEAKLLAMLNVFR